ncbi:hypothetical protein KA977_11815 [Candidatus Dependentiae bacterium]|nr:hypothetical protein [Candidatus Dependentiae bacterium]
MNKNIIALLLSVIFVLIIFRALVLNYNTHLINAAPYTSLSTQRCIEDKYVFLWSLWWTDRALQGKNPLLTTNFLFDFSPTSLIYNTNSIYQHFISKPFIKILKPDSGVYIAQYNIYLIITRILSVFFMFVLLNYITPENFISNMFLSFLFILHPYVFKLTDQLNIASTELFPLLIYFLLKFSNTENFKYSFFIGILLSLQIFSSPNYWAASLIIIATWCVFCFFSKIKNIKKTIFSLIIIFATHTFLISPFLYQVFFSNIDKNIPVFYPLKYTYLLSINIKDLFIQHSHYSVYFGYFLLSILLFSFFINKNFNLKFGLSLFFTFLILSLGAYLCFDNFHKIFSNELYYILKSIAGEPFANKAKDYLGIPLPYILINKLPVIKGFRAPYLFFIIVLISMLFSASFVFNSLKVNKKLKLLILITFFSVSVIEYSPYKYNLTKIIIPDFYNIIKNDTSEKSVLEIPVSRDRNHYMYFQTYHEKKLLLSGVISRFNYKQKLKPLIYIEDDFIDTPYYSGGRKIWFKEWQAKTDWKTLSEKYNVGYIVFHKNLLNQSGLNKLKKLVAENFFKLIYEDEYDTVLKI